MEKEKLVQTSEYKEEHSEILGGSGPKIPKKALIIVGIVVLVGIIAIGAFSMLTSKKDPPIEEVTSEENTIVFEYTAEQKDQLMAAGYTGKQIEDNEAAMYDFQALIEEAKKKQEEFLKSTYAELNAKSLTSASPEYKELLNKTWLGGAPTTVQPDAGKDEYTFDQETIKDNVDYVKLPPRGNQLFLMMTFPDGSRAFYPVHPQRFYQLKEKGNIVVTYDLVTFGGKKFITNIMEVPL